MAGFAYPQYISCFIQKLRIFEKKSVFFVFFIKIVLLVGDGKNFPAVWGFGGYVYLRS